MEIPDLSHIDLSHITSWPPSSSTITGLAFIICGVVLLPTCQLEVALPLIVGGLTAVVLKEKSDEHGEKLETLHNRVSDIETELGSTEGGTE